MIARMGNIFIPRPDKFNKLPVWQWRKGSSGNQAESSVLRMTDYSANVWKNSFVSTKQNFFNRDLVPELPQHYSVPRPKKLNVDLPQMAKSACVFRILWSKTEGKNSILFASS